MLGGVGRPDSTHTCTAAHELHIGAVCPPLGDVIASRACGTERSERATEDPTPAVFVPFSSICGSAGVESGAASANACGAKFNNSACLGLSILRMVLKM